MLLLDLGSSKLTPTGESTPSANPGGDMSGLLSRIMKLPAELQVAISTDMVANILELLDSDKRNSHLSSVTSYSALLESMQAAFLALSTRELNELLGGRLTVYDMMKVGWDYGDSGTYIRGITSLDSPTVDETHISMLDTNLTTWVPSELRRHVQRLDLRLSFDAGMLVKGYLPREKLFQSLIRRVGSLEQPENFPNLMDLKIIICGPQKRCDRDLVKAWLLPRIQQTLDTLGTDSGLVYRAQELSSLNRTGT